jgi:hypothetical protein
MISGNLHNGSSQWKIEEAQDGAVIISNIGLGSPVYAGNDVRIPSSTEEPF